MGSLCLGGRGAGRRLPYLPGNSDYGAFYDVEDLPSEGNIREAIKALPQNLVYGDFASILYRAFVDLGIPTKLFPIIYIPA